ncbi:glycosyl hydrolase [Aquiflexum sp. TKW24L]|uniref:glycosyl hydrolase n=1 Tax=Aquiflexum sp. TKW24L TaxID=2942212 RepID=UPI0020BF7F87|nr:glycosyl hydrolase [Aquiflexum sp. TKW24L]MCL6258256.1 glycosyl hydrolase [Aquiflexum sp. TKW24L]
MKQFYRTNLFALFLIISGIVYSSPVWGFQENGNPCNNSSRYLYWVGDVDNDFFNELNWRETTQKPSTPNPPGQTGIPGQSAKPECLPGANKKPNTICLNDHNPDEDKIPRPGSLTPGQPISFNLYIEGSEIFANGEIVFGCADFGLTLSGAKLESDFVISQGVISLDNESTLKISASKIPLALKFDFLDAASWIYWNGITPDLIGNSLDNHIKINGLETTKGSGYRINQYYQKGALIRPIDANYTALSVFSDIDFGGNKGELNELIIYKGAQIPNGMDKATHSFVLKRGYMATFAVNENGTSKGKVYIASEEDMYVEALPEALQGNVRFIRVIPWNWVTKKGTGGFFDQLDAGWYYNWGLGSTSRPNYEYVPMAWGAGGASPASVQSVILKENITHFLGFNESDNCSGESGQFNNLCQPSVAVAYYESLMGSGLRLGSPAPRENGPTGWLRDFYNIAKERDVRFDFVAVHWYDWGSNPANSPNANPQDIFNRFKNYLENVHNIYKMPIWITEFNANPNRGNEIQQAFLELALPYLENLDYVERYAYFQPNPNNSSNPNVTTAFYYDENSNLTNIGELYLSHQSTPSIKESNYAPNNSLEGLDLPFVPKEVNSMIFEVECGNYLGSKWDILDDATASNGKFLRGNLENDGASPIAGQVHFDFEIDGADSYRVWIKAFSTPGINGALRFKMDNGPMEQIVPFNSNEFIWFQVPRIYDLGEGKHRLTLEFPNTAIRLDQVALINGSFSLEGVVQEPGYCLPTDNFWGLEQSDVLDFYEAETAQFGSDWTAEVDAKAINGLFIMTADQNSSLEEAPQGPGMVEFEFEVETTDEYEIWAKIQSLTMEGESALWISVDDNPFRKWSDLQNDLFIWYWKKFHYSYASEARNFSYFLEAGLHKVKIAYASGTVAIDRIALATKGKNPADVDPDVVNLVENLELEAELATILGTAQIVNCGSSSNGKQVNMGNLNTNGVKFDQIVAETAGAYRLQISYMSAVQRNFRLTVNGENLGQQVATSSGAWCFGGGVPGIWEINVQLNEGINIIQVNPFSGDAPFIDKIKLVKSVKIAPSFISLEAEKAQLIGTFPSPACGTASNGFIVNMGFNTGNAIKFNEVNVVQSGAYNVEFHYFSNVVRKLRIITNGVARTVNFQPTGAFCFAGGVPGKQTVELQLEAGDNVIQLTPIEGDAPIMDKIVITSQEPEREVMRKISTEWNMDLTTEKILENKEFNVFPNPVKSGASVTIQVPGVKLSDASILVRLTDMTGRTIFAEAVNNTETQLIHLNNTLNKGIYVVMVQHGNQWFAKRLIVE